MALRLLLSCVVPLTVNRNNASKKLCGIDQCVKFLDEPVFKARAHQRIQHFSVMSIFQYFWLMAVEGSQVQRCRWCYQYRYSLSQYQSYWIINYFYRWQHKQPSISSPLGNFLPWEFYHFVIVLSERKDRSLNTEDTDCCCCSQCFQGAHRSLSSSSNDSSFFQPAAQKQGCLHLKGTEDAHKMMSTSSCWHHSCSYLWTIRS